MITLAQILGAIPQARPIQVYHGGQQMDELGRFNLQKRQLEQAAERQAFSEGQTQHENEFAAEREATRQSELGARTGEDRRRYDANSQEAILKEALPLLQNPDTMHMGQALLRQGGFGVDAGEKPVTAPKPYMPQPAGETVAPARTLSDVGRAPPTPNALPNKYGATVPGNVDLTHRPHVKNADGSVSTVLSMGVNIDGQEVLIPKVSDDGRIMSDDEAVAEYKRSGKHLGIYPSQQASDAAAQAIHEDQMANPPVNTLAGGGAPALRLGDVGGGLTSISNPAGRPLAAIDYGAMHRAQVQRATAELDQLVASAGPIDVNSSAQARAMIPEVLASNGYNTKAAAARVYETFYKRQALEHGDIRAQEMAGLGRERIAASAHRGGENIQLKQWAQGEASAHRTWTTQQAQQHIGQYRSVNDALGKLAANPTNPATYASVIYAMAKSNDARGVVTNRDFDVAAGVTDLAGQGEEKIAQWFAGEAGRAHLPQILEYLKKQKQVTELNSLKDAEALAKQYKEQPSQTHRRAFGSVLDRFAEMPFFPALVKELDMAGAVQEPMMDGSFDESSSSSVETEDSLRGQGLLP